MTYFKKITASFALTATMLSGFTAAPAQANDQALLGLLAGVAVLAAINQNQNSDEQHGQRDERNYRQSYHRQNEFQYRDDYQNQDNYQQQDDNFQYPTECQDQDNCQLQDNYQD